MPWAVLAKEFTLCSPSHVLYECDDTACWYCQPGRAWELVVHTCACLQPFLIWYWLEMFRFLVLYDFHSMTSFAGAIILQCGLGWLIHARQLPDAMYKPERVVSKSLSVSGGPNLWFIELVTAVSSFKDSNCQTQTWYFDPLASKCSLTALLYISGRECLQLPFIGPVLMWWPQHSLYACNALWPDQTKFAFSRSASSMAKPLRVQNHLAMHNYVQLLSLCG